MPGLMDGDGSGAIDIDELHSAFKMLGLRVTKKSVSELLAQVDSDGSGACYSAQCLAQRRDCM